MSEMMKAAAAFDIPEVRMSVKEQKRLAELMEKRKQLEARSDQGAIEKIDAEIEELRADSRRKN